MQNFKILKEINNIGNIKQYLIESDGKNYILSYTKGDEGSKVLMRAAEVMKAVSNIVSVPHVVDCWSKGNEHYMIENCIEGTKLCKNNISNEDIVNIVKNIKKLHGVRCENTIDKCLILAKMHMDNNMLDNNEFIIDGKETDPQEIFNYLVKNKDVFTNCSLLHGDFNLKNIIKGNDGKYYFTNWFNCIYGDFYYDLATLMWDLDGENNKQLFDLYGEKEVNGKRLLFADYLSKFLRIN